MGGRTINVVKPVRARNDKLVLIDVAKFDAAFARDRYSYVGAGGTGNAIGQRYPKVQEYLSKASTIEAAEVYIREDGGVAFTNGRHRYAALRDAGVTELPMALTPEAAQNAIANGLVVGSKAPEKIVVRPEGWEAGSDDVAKMTREGHLYRGMSEAEYMATIAAGLGIKSNLSASIPSAEGTNFSTTAQDAESYANFGPTDPRKSGVPNYLVEVKQSDKLTVKPDGYYHVRGELPRSEITRIWKMEAEGGAVVAREVPLPEDPTDLPAQAEPPNPELDAIMSPQELARFHELEENYKTLPEAELMEYTKLSVKFEQRWDAASKQKQAQDIIKQEEARVAELKRQGAAICKTLGFDHSRVDYVKGSREFEVNGVKHTAGGDADIYNKEGNGHIRIYTDHIHGAEAMAGVTAHEIEHFKVQTAINAYRRDYAEALKERPEPVPDHAYWWGKKGGVDAVFTPSEGLHPPFDTKYPAYAEMHEAMFQHPYDEFAEGDGVTKYSAEYWKGYHDGKVNVELAFHETLAEMAKVKFTTGEFPTHYGYSPIIRERNETRPVPAGEDYVPKQPNEKQGQTMWRDLYRAVERVYKAEQKK